MDHVLDNPVWNALNSGNKHLSVGDDFVRVFPEDVSPFVGLKEQNESNFKLLYDMVPESRTVAVVTAKDITVPDQWKIIYKTQLWQMTCTVPQQPLATPPELVPLTDANIPAMLELTALTNPGPFYQRTIDFGNYYGIFDGDKLIAMAGHRLSIDQYTEISAVCTHPDHNGKGYGKLLMNFQKQFIYSLGRVPMLHVRNDNFNAIKLYESLGFAKRAEMTIQIIKKR